MLTPLQSWRCWSAYKVRIAGNFSWKQRGDMRVNREEHMAGDINKNDEVLNPPKAHRLA